MDTIDKLEAGRELDKRIAEGVMGWKNIVTGNVTNDYWGDPPEPSEHGRRVPYYSTYDGDAVEVLNKLIGMRCEIDINSNEPPRTWACYVRGYDGPNPVIDVFGIHDDFAMAVCEAAVKFIAATKYREEQIDGR